MKKIIIILMSFLIMASCGKKNYCEPAIPKIKTKYEQCLTGYTNLNIQLVYRQISKEQYREASKRNFKESIEEINAIANACPRNPVTKNDRDDIFAYKTQVILNINDLKLLD